MSQTTVQSYFQQILKDWVDNGRFPDTTIEACAPTLAAKLGAPAEHFSFDKYVHSAPTPDWNLKPLECGDLTSSLFLYLPTKWSDFEKVENATQVSDRKFTRQSIYLIDRHTWKNELGQFFGQGEVTGFVYYLIQPPDFHQWICCVDNGNRVWLYAFYTSPDKLLITKADAADQSLLEVQLTSLINSNPWYGFVKPA